MKTIYLDNAATTKPLDDFIASTQDYLETSWFNPSAVYKPGVTVKTDLEVTRSLAKSITNGKYKPYFTSCGTEGAFFSIMSVVNFTKDAKNKNYITTMGEHPAVYNTFLQLKKLGYNVTFLPIDNYGFVSLDDLKNAVNTNTALVSIMHVNNITGATNDITAINSLIKHINPSTVFHSDGVQGFMRCAFPVCDIYTVSGHKINALKGIGIMYIREGYKFLGGLPGGGQEYGFRSGTENTLGIKSLNYAIDFWKNNSTANVTHMCECKDAFIKSISDIKDVIINSPIENAAPHILNFSVAGVGGEILLHSLELENIFVSTGSACSSRQKDTRINDALHMTKEISNSQIRVSFAYDTPIADIYLVCDKINKIATTQRKIFRRN